jgi:hypothetical protein
MSSCAAWLSWKCQMSSGTAREHVRVARALRSLSVIRGEFAAGRLSYAKVRALTRIATPENEAGLAEISGPMTGNQLERFPHYQQDDHDQPEPFQPRAWAVNPLDWIVEQGRQRAAPDRTQARSDPAGAPARGATRARLM